MKRTGLLAVFSLFVFSIVLLVSISSLHAQNYKQRRLNLVRNHLVDPSHGAPITDTRVLNAMRTVPRHRFVAPSLRDEAYRNKPLPIAHGQTISQPYIVALMTQLLDPEPDDKILEIGTGSGYQAAVLSEVVSEVYSVEIIPELAESARTKLSRAGYDTVTVKQGDGYYGWKKHAPYDGIVVTAAPSSIPPPLMNQLKPMARLVIPVGPPFRTQRLMIVTKRDDGSFRKQTVLPVSFVPFQRSASK